MISLATISIIEKVHLRYVEHSASPNPNVLISPIIMVSAILKEIQLRGMNRMHMKWFVAL